MTLRLIALLLGLLSAWIFAGPLRSRMLVQAVEEPVAEQVLAVVEPGSFEVRVQAVGELQPVRSTTVFSAIKSDRGKIIFIVADGAEVAEGDILVRFDPTPFEEQAARAGLDVGLAQSLVEVKQQALEWEKVQAGRRAKAAQYELDVAVLEQHRLERGDGPLETAQMEIELAEKTSEFEEQSGFLGELEDLRVRGHVNVAEVEQVKKRAEKARRLAELSQRQFDTYRDFILPTRKATLKYKVEQADAELQQGKQSSGFRIGEMQATLRHAERDLAAAEARLAEAETELERTVLRAPIPGMVVLRADYREGERRVPRVGDTVWQNQPLLYLPDLSQMVVMTKVREVDIHKVQPGNEAVVRLDAYPELVLEATVHSIGVLAEREPGSDGGAKYFQMLIDLDTSGPRLRPGMTARADVLSSRIQGELIVPVQALWEKDGETWCWVPGEQGFERRVVQVGPRSRYWAAILSGLAEGDSVSLVDPLVTPAAGAVR